MTQQILTKRQVDVSILVDGYNYYQMITPPDQQLTKTEYKQIYNEWCKISKELVLNTGDGIHMIGGLGELRIQVKERNFNDLRGYRDIDWKRTKELGKYVYYKDDMRAAIVWNRKPFPALNREYFFRAIRSFRRAVTPKIKIEKKEYFHYATK